MEVAPKAIKNLCRARCSRQAIARQDQTRRYLTYLGKWLNSILLVTGCSEIIAQFLYLHRCHSFLCSLNRDEREPEDTVREGTACPVIIARYAAVTQMN